MVKVSDLPAIRDDQRLFLSRSQTKTDANPKVCVHPIESVSAAAAVAAVITAVVAPVTAAAIAAPVPIAVAAAAQNDDQNDDPQPAPAAPIVIVTPHKVTS